MEIEVIKKNKVRGPSKKEELISDYWISPVSHIALLQNQNRICVCGDKITTDYYVYKAKNKETKETTYFNAGTGCSRQINSLAGIASLPVTNVHQVVGNNVNNEGYNGRNGGARNTIEFSPFNSELMKVIGIYCTSMDWYPYKLANISEFTISRPQLDNKQGAIWFNEWLVGRNTSISAILEVIAAENNIREFHFPLLQAYLEEETDDCRIDM